MAESGLLGLVATVSLPLAFIGSVRLGWHLWRAIIASVGGYLILAAGLACLPPTGMLPKASLAAATLLGAAMWVRGSARSAEGENHPKVPISRLRTMLLRTATPVIYLLMLGIAQDLAGPSWAGLVSTFPSLSLVMLIVTYFESGPAEASRIAQVLPSGNSSTLAFLAVYRVVCPDTGVVWASLAGYGAALGILICMQWAPKGLSFVTPPKARLQPIRLLGGIIWRNAAEPFRLLRGIHCRLPRAHVRGAVRDRVRRRAHQCGFAPLVETLAW
jgi:hypothetical protein